MTSSMDDKYIATLTRIRADIIALDSVKIWNIQSQKNITTISSTSKIKGVEFHPDGKRILILQETANLDCRVSLWNIETGDKEREINIPQISYNSRQYELGYYKTKIIDSGRRVAIIDREMHFVNLE